MPACPYEKLDSRHCQGCAIKHKLHERISSGRGIYTSEADAEALNYHVSYLEEPKQEGRVYLLGQILCPERRTIPVYGNR